MRVALIGPASTGKTTLAHAISREFHVPVISECIRTSAKTLGITNISNVDRETRIMLQSDALRLQQSVEGIYHHGFISDRSSLDYAAYARGFFGDCMFTRIYSDVAAQSQYDFIIYTPPFDDQGQIDDGFRLDSDTFATIEDTVRRQLSDASIVERLIRPCSYYQLRSIDQGGRIDELKNIIPWS